MFYIHYTHIHIYVMWSIYGNSWGDVGAVVVQQWLPSEGQEFGSSVHAAGCLSTEPGARILEAS